MPHQMEHTLTMQPVSKPSLPVLSDAEENPDIPQQSLSTTKPFINANTIDATFEEISREHILPVFIKDNEPLISQSDFIDAAHSIVREIYHGETILNPSIRLSHPVKGRIPDARNKPANELEEWERT